MTARLRSEPHPLWMGEECKKVKLLLEKQFLRLATPTARVGMPSPSIGRSCPPLQCKDLDKSVFVHILEIKTSGGPAIRTAAVTFICNYAAWKISSTTPRLPKAIAPVAARTPRMIEMIRTRMNPMKNDRA